MTSPPAVVDRREMMDILFTTTTCTVVLLYYFLIILDRVCEERCDSVVGVSNHVINIEPMKFIPPIFAFSPKSHFFCFCIFLEILSYRQQLLSISYYSFYTIYIVL